MEIRLSGLYSQEVENMLHVSIKRKLTHVIYFTGPSRAPDPPTIVSPHPVRNTEKKSSF